MLNILPLINLLNPETFQNEKRSSFKTYFNSFKINSEGLCSDI
jgi:hypothetical protein